MGKLAIISAGFVVVLGVLMFVLLGCGSRGPSAQALFQTRLEAAQTGSGAEQVVELGPISERDGIRGLYGDVIIVKGSYAQWHAALDKNFFPSLPRPTPE